VVKCIVALPKTMGREHGDWKPEEHKPEVYRRENSMGVAAESPN
jgi:hypothetical protein